MATVKIYGASDDLLEVVGDVLGCNEYNPADGRPSFVEFSTGDVYRVEYTRKGVWKVTQHVNGRSGCVAVKEPHGKGDDPDPYTETVTVTGDIDWVRFCPAWPMTPADVRQLVIAYMEGREIDDLDDTVIESIYKSITA